LGFGGAAFFGFLASRLDRFWPLAMASSEGRETPAYRRIGAAPDVFARKMIM
jgi:hypothetical protein